MELIPAIDLLNGCAVRLHQGRYDEVTTFTSDVLGAARDFAAQGATRLHVVDLDAARLGRPAESGRVADLVRHSGLPVQVGGGIRDLEAVRHWLVSVGAERVVLGTAAIRDPEMVKSACTEFPGRIVVAVDAREGWVAVDGWQQATTTRASALASAMDDAGVAALLFTDIARDGTGSGAAVDATAELQRQVRATVIASGGIGSISDLLALRGAGVRAAVCGRAIWSGAFTVGQALSALESSSW
jgi:phosphoribosylformimino-5-aminoimidazole carboxamide ribotide isomerase